ncbi:purine-nucleoside phosphorylase [Granulicella tundricola]|uniref:Purine nucleoside permease n=1 Tax=Granulicella tundricola (strain ATCC BAA-1859 / DSM 23138 / MP5ACTX9) TaxID=1198114 RepID=E8X157_GRATM|nr:purine nucleoside permease [Granulicella tundricola]ADW67923.1 purine nucleoside permease [Granulicella tundricola MP5ACTX9]
MQRIKLVLIAAFEPDWPLNEGPVPGELTLFRQRNNLTQTIPLEAAYRPLLTDGAGTLALATGVGAARAAASVMALGLDPRFDLTNARFLITGVAGATPTQASLASVVLPDYVVDGDLTHELDAREIPAEWPDGFIPIGKTTPYEAPRAARFNNDDGIVFQLNSTLIERAFNLTRNIILEDTPQITERRAQFSPAQSAPKVLRGDELSSSTFFHGRLMSQRATRWVSYQTEGQATYTITAMEDTGILQSLTFLAAAGKLDFNRVLIARAVSNYDQQREDITAAESLAETKVATYSAYRPALENAHRVATAIIQSLDQDPT